MDIVFKLQEGYMCVCFWGGTKGLMMGLQSQQKSRAFVFCQIVKFITFFVNKSRSVDKPRVGRSGTTTYLKGESPKVRTTHSWFADFSLTDRKLLQSDWFSANLLTNMLIKKKSAERGIFSWSKNILIFNLC